MLGDNHARALQKPVSFYSRFPLLICHIFVLCLVIATIQNERRENFSFFDFLLYCCIRERQQDIGTQSMQELFFCVIAAFAELFTAMIWLSFLVAMYSTKATGNL